jgi:hypothetical protein
MWYWYGEARNLERQLVESEKVIGLYSDITGVQARTEETMRQAFDLKYAVALDCVPALEKANERLGVYKNRSTRRAYAIGIGIPIALGVGFIFGLMQ